MAGLSRFLRFIVETHLDGRDDEIKESVIAVEVLGRSPDHDPKRNSIVRTEATRLRARLHEYYSGEGRHDALVIELPKGGYVPAFRENGVVQVNGAAPAALASRRWRIFSVASASLALVVLGVWWVTARKPATISIAVLPLTELSPNAGDNYFADGLTDEMIRNVSIIEGLAVRSQTSSFALKGKVRNAKEAGQQLNVDYILEGSVLHDANRLRIDVQLVRVRDDFAIWSGRYDRELRDVLALQDEIARGVVNSLRLKLGAGRRRYDVNPQAYDRYLHARVLAEEKGIRGVNESVVPLREAVILDSTFAPAYAALASASAVRSGEFKFNIPEELANMRQAAGKAIELDPLLAEAYHAQGMRYARDGQWREAEGNFRQAIRIDPNSSETRMHFALDVLMPLGRLREALEQADTAAASDPLSTQILEMKAVLLMAAGQYQKVEHLSLAMSEVPMRSLLLARARLYQGRTDDAIRILEASYRDASAGGEIRSALVLAYTKAGRRADAEKIAAQTPSLNPFNDAKIAASFGDREGTLRALDRAAMGGPVRIGCALVEPEMAFLAGDPRVKTLRKKVGLPQ